LVVILMASSPVFADEPKETDSTGAGYDGTRAGRTPPRLRARQSDVQGDLDRAAIRKVIRRHLAPLRKCVENAPFARKELRLVFRIEVDGTVSKVEVKGFGAKADACLATALRAMKFGSLPGVVQVSYPMLFTR
jgi:hypothetical protein